MCSDLNSSNTKTFGEVYGVRSPEHLILHGCLSNCYRSYGSVDYETPLIISLYYGGFFSTWPLPCQLLLKIQLLLIVNAWLSHSHLRHSVHTLLWKQNYSCLPGLCCSMQYQCFTNIWLTSMLLLVRWIISGNVYGDREPRHTEHMVQTTH